MKYKPSRDILLAATELKDLSPSKIVAWILNKRNEKRSPESITMWFKDHPEVFEQLKKEIIGGAPTEKQAVSDDLFENATFQLISSVKEWMLFMNSRRHKGRKLHPEYVKEQLRLLRWACHRFSKHPDRLTLHDAQEIFLTLEEDREHSHWEGDEKKSGMDTACLRRAIKDFLKSKGVSGWEKVGVGKPSGYGHYKDMNAPHETVLKMLKWVTKQDFWIGTIDTIMYTRGIRMNAVLTSQIDKFKREREWDFLTVREKFGETSTFKLPKRVGDMIIKVIGDRKEGKIFAHQQECEVAELNRRALKLFLPELERKIVFPDHVFRHFCAQYLRRITKGNSGLCAGLMKCSKQSFDESYGGLTVQEIEDAENEILPMMMVEYESMNKKTEQELLNVLTASKNFASL